MKVPETLSEKIKTAGNLLAEIFTGDLFALVIYPKDLMNKAGFVTNADKNTMADALEDVAVQLRRSDNPEVAAIFDGGGSERGS